MVDCTVFTVDAPTDGGGNGDGGGGSGDGIGVGLVALVLGGAWWLSRGDDE